MLSLSWRIHLCTSKNQLINVSVEIDISYYSTTLQSQQKAWYGWTNFFDDDMLCWRGHFCDRDILFQIDPEMT